MIRKLLKREPREGHWIKFVENNRQHKIECSKCGYTEPEYATFIRNYCPNCGKRMQTEMETE